MPAPSNAPPHFCCPITLDVMNNPVIAPDGNSYELSALEDWYRSEQASGRQGVNLPTTNKPFTLDQLVPNRALKDAIDQWRAASGLTAPVAAPATSAPDTTTAAATTTVQKPTHLGIPRTRYFQSPDGSAMISVPPASGPNRHLHVVAVVDVSGSMGTTASMRDETGEKSEVANTVLDIVKYAAKAVAHMLGPKDTFTLIKFTNVSTTVLKCHKTETDNDLKEIDAAISRLEPEGMTNLGDGLRLALQEVADHHQDDPDRLNVVMMLTDGQPNQGPVAIDVLNSFRRSDKVLPANRSTGAPETTIGAVITNQTIVNTFAFGYASSSDGLASSLMFDVATAGNGIFGYIPDIGFLGTQFIHCVANMRVIASVTSAELGEKGHEAPSRVGLWTTQYGKVGFSCNAIESLAAVDFSKPINATNKADNDALAPLSEAEIAAVKKAMPSAVAAFSVSKELLHCLRGPVTTCKYNQEGARIDDGKKSFKTVTEDEAKGRFGKLAHLFPALEGLEEDITSQVVIAFKPDFYVRWGLHYLYSWLSAHQHLVCNNFKDKSLETHKTDLMRAIHDKYDDIFNMMPPPEPTIREPAPVLRTAIIGGGGGCNSAAPQMAYASTAAPQRKMFTSSKQMNSRSNPCVHEDTRVLMADGVTWLAAKALKSGDAVRGFGPSAATLVIDHVIRTQCEGARGQFVCFPAVVEAEAGSITHGLRVTAWHPVLVKDTPAQVARGEHYTAGSYEWMLPVDTGYDVEEHDCAHVYSFTVAPAGEGASRVPALMTEGVPLVYLAHGVTSSDAERQQYPNERILTHPFFGTPAVLKQLTDAHPHNKHHEFAPSPVNKGASPCGGDVIAVGWDMSKYVGTW